MPHPPEEVVVHENVEQLPTQDRFYQEKNVLAILVSAVEAHDEIAAQKRHDAALVRHEAPEVLFDNVFLQQDLHGAELFGLGITHQQHAAESTLTEHPNAFQARQIVRPSLCCFSFGASARGHTLERARGPPPVCRPAHASLEELVGVLLLFHLCQVAVGRREMLVAFVVDHAGPGHGVRTRLLHGFDGLRHHEKTSSVEDQNSGVLGLDNNRLVGGQGLLELRFTDPTSLRKLALELTVL
mmetsp:Transcript_114776/g.324372  ORF Transcript_114776/g.324372 Transcript_114776/m.324372 type:complete len:241 (+) Transcript_114776:845-1567(+)